MKPGVALINASPGELFGGQERFCLQLAQGLAQYFEFTIICEDGYLAEEAERLGIRTIQAPLRVGLVKAIRVMSGLIKDHNFRVLHSMDSRGNLISRLTYRQHADLVRLSTRHELYDCDCFGTYYRTKRRFIAFSDRITAKYSDRIMVVCEAIRKEMLNQGYRNSQIEVVYNGISDELADEAGTLQKDERKNEHQIIAVGRLSSEKGFAYLIDATGILVFNSLPVQVKIAGTGPLEDELRKRIKKSGLEKHIELLGYVDNISPWLRTSAILAVPSVHEAFSLVVLEGMAAGLPVIGSRIGGIPEAVREGENGILFEAGNVRELANAMTELLADANKRVIFGERSRKLVRANFRFTTTLDKVRYIYEEELSKKA